MVSRRNYAAITIVMAIVFFLFQFLNMAKDHWNNYSTKPVCQKCGGASRSGQCISCFD